jgi:hypothetical protein
MTATVKIHPAIAVELFAIRKTEWSVAEYRALADRFADAVQSLQIAVANEQFAGIRSAFLTLHEIAGQTAFLNTGLCHAIQAVQQQKDSAS